MKNSWICSIFGMILTLFLATEASAMTQIGIRFVVSETLGSNADKQKQTKIKLQGYIDELNQYYKNSKVELQAKLVNVTFAKIVSVEAVKILEDMQQEKNGFTNLFQQAKTLKADFTVAVADKLTISNKPGCGRALAVNQTREAISSLRNALMVFNFVCGSHTLAHELGHLMGLNHGSLVNSCEPNHGHQSAIAPYANGYGLGNCDSQPQPGEFGTIMVGGWMGKVYGNDKASLRMFSNPRIRDPRCGIKQICGDPATGDAARALNENAPYYVHTK
ncbi:MAG: hypothetical protein HQL94_08035 [Magnetococcales bacterium]|nr:hypothetical protein [Magnetococcales bacterium]MBF0438125.1 hypothetical protein [Magnetococcales bacterium]